MPQGLRPGDILLQVRNQELMPPEPPIFPVGEDSQYAVQKPDGKRIVGTLNRSVAKVEKSSRDRSQSSFVFTATRWDRLAEGDHVSGSGRD